MRKTFELENNFEKFQKMTITTLEIVKYSKMTLSLRSKFHTKILNWVNMKNPFVPVLRASSSRLSANKCLNNMKAKYKQL